MSLCEFLQSQELLKQPKINITVKVQLLHEKSMDQIFADIILIKHKCPNFIEPYIDSKNILETSQYALSIYLLFTFFRLWW